MCRDCNLLAQVLDLCGFERFVPNQLSHTGFDAVQIPDNLHGTFDACCFPPRNRLQLGEHLVEALLEIGQDMIGIRGQPMISIRSGGCPTHNDRIRKNALQLSPISALASIDHVVNRGESELLMGQMTMQYDNTLSRSL